jgi:acyl carrier protein
MSESELEALMIGILERELGIPVSADANMFERGADSLVLIRLIDAVEDSCGITLDIETILERGTVRDIVRALV